MIAVALLSHEAAKEDNAARPLATAARDGQSPATLYESWAGTRAQHEAAEVLVSFELNGDYGACMKSHGYERDWRDVVQPAPVARDPLAHSLWAAGPLHGQYAARLQRSEKLGRMSEVQNAVEAKGDEHQAEMDCLRSSPSADDATVDGLRYPDGLTDLEAAWAKALQPIATAEGGVERYNDCMRESGVLATFAVDDALAARQALSTRTIEDVPLNEKAASADWAQFLEAEKALADADWACRSPVQEQVQELVTQQLDEFAADHSDQIARLRSRWASIEARARQLGWSAGDPAFEARLEPTD